MITNFRNKKKFLANLEANKKKFVLINDKASDF